MNPRYTFSLRGLGKEWSPSPRLASRQVIGVLLAPQVPLRNHENKCGTQIKVHPCQAEERQSLWTTSKPRAPKEPILRCVPVVVQSKHGHPFLVGFPQTGKSRNTRARHCATQKLPSSPHQTNRPPWGDFCFPRQTPFPASGRGRSPRLPRPEPEARDIFVWEPEGVEALRRIPVHQSEREAELFEWDAPILFLAFGQVVEN